VDAICALQVLPEGEVVADTLLVDADERFMFARRLGTGLAGGAGVPGTRPRRRFAGVLGKFALKDRRFLMATTMEPELAFLMASLARVGPGARVLDPCCGSGGLLLSAAALGAASLVGLDTDPAALAGAGSNFEFYGLGQPELLLSDLLDPAASPALDGTRYSAIVCDPPYGMKTRVSAEASGRAASIEPEQARVQVAQITRALLRLAQLALAPGGRLVFFLPLRGSDALEDSAGVLALLQAWAPDEMAGLELLASRKQSFSPTFARWLLVLTIRADTRRDGEARGRSSGLNLMI
jgi:SAM-dependent methyltransferase